VIFSVKITKPRIEQTPISAALHVALFALAGYPMNIEDSRTMKKMAAFAVLGIVLLGLGYVLWDYLTVDRCLDRGGKWDAPRSRCIGAVVTD
jgi:drug/metabolite transporter (DMT)-like permease